jgi:GNAT superfamily N-acetyltransferase
MEIRKFKSSDEEQCIAIRKECWEKLLSKCYPKGISQKWTHKYKKGDLVRYAKKHDMWVAEEKERVSGFFSIEVKGNKAKIGLNFVRYSERGKGIGGDLYRCAERITLKKYPKIKTVIADSVWYKPSIRFYESLGFKKIRKVIYNENPKDRTLWMEKQI